MRPHLRRFALITGAVLGFSWGFASLGWHHAHHRRHLEEHVAAVCVDAALRAPRARTAE